MQRNLGAPMGARMVAGLLSAVGFGLLLWVVGWAVAADP